jgi:hypothetical protein
VIVKRIIQPGHRKYLPPTQYSEGEAPTRDCGAKAPEGVFDVQWACSREKGHSGDHAAHAALSRTPDMVARWGGEG